jgi:hypothetical protein
MKATGEVTVERDGKVYGATYEVKDSMVIVKTHTETRSVQLGQSAPEVLARQVLNEIIDADRRPK